MAKYIFLSSLALTILVSTEAQFAPYPGSFAPLYPSPRLPWTPLPYTRPFVPPLAYGGSPAIPSPAASSLMPSTLYPAPMRPRPLAPLSPYPLAPSPYGQGAGAIPFGSSFAASFPASAYAPAPISPISPLAPSPFSIPQSPAFAGVRFGPSRPQLQVTKLDDL